jgi:general stress protein YciG
MANNSDGRGFAGMDPERQRRIAAKGGKAAHQSGHAHEFDSREAVEAGRKGGKAAHGGTDRDRDRQGRFE